MAKYNAIYEGRLPHGIYNKIIGEGDAARQRGLTAYLTHSITNIYQIFRRIFRR